MRVAESFVDHVFVREDGFISVGTPYGPWFPGIKQCMNRKNILKGHKPAFYYRYFTPYQKAYLVHRMVACAFCVNPNPTAFRVVDHIDGNSLNNATTNLRWINTALNRLNNKARNTFWDSRRKKWMARVAGKHLGYFFVEREAWIVAQTYKAQLFRKTYLSFVQGNESETTRAGAYIRGPPHCTTPTGPVVPRPRNCGVGFQLAETQHFHNKLPSSLPASVLLSEGQTSPCYPHPVNIGCKRKRHDTLDETRYEGVPRGQAAQQEGNPGC